jgi:hypothetical protein
MPRQRTTTPMSAGILLGLALGCAAGESSGDQEALEPSGAGGSSVEMPARPPAPPPATEPPLFDTKKPEPPPERCDKVDFLYVVDNSASMTDKQENLARSFEGFTRIVQETLGTTDHQIMVVDTDGINVGDIIAGYGAESGDGCTGMLGAGLTMGAEGEGCIISGNQRFLQDDQPNLADTFSCLARVGTLGNADERPIDALLAATGAAHSDAEMCNEGFLRNDAILVVTLITDEEDEQSAGDPAKWKQALLRAKHGNEEALVMLGLIGDTQVPGGLPGGPCDEVSGADSPRLQRFVESFELGSLGSVCAPDYSEFFAQAVSTIDTACEVFTPILY